ncbi:hypothetical protein KSP40_PGU013095 [Platanthera guangdongensis]|uniref:Uncharacterized protein n=1 Tax=Platanthera guangdongensis TaxID=2320717 RepID=A0ABR2MXX5_9ASPA
MSLRRETKISLQRRHRVPGQVGPLPLRRARLSPWRALLCRRHCLCRRLPPLLPMLVPKRLKLPPNAPASLSRDDDTQESIIVWIGIGVPVREHLPPRGGKTNAVVRGRWRLLPQTFVTAAVTPRLQHRLHTSDSKPYDDSSHTGSHLQSKRTLISLKECCSKTTAIPARLTSTLPSQIFQSFVDEGLVSVRNGAAASNGPPDESGDLFISSNRQLQVTRGDALQLQVLARIPYQLQNLNGQVPISDHGGLRIAEGLWFKISKSLDEYADQNGRGLTSPELGLTLRESHREETRLFPGLV